MAGDTTRATPATTRAPEAAADHLTTLGVKEVIKKTILNKMIMIDYVSHHETVKLT